MRFSTTALLCIGTGVAIVLTVLLVNSTNTSVQGYEADTDSPSSSFYSQDRQDEFLERELFRGFKNGFFVDVGAHDGVSLNNTLYFEKKKGWTGINIEPNPSVFTKLVKNRPRCINLSLAVSDKEGTATFMIQTGADMLSGLQATYDQRHLERIQRENSLRNGSTQEHTAQTRRLSTIFKDHKVKRVHYLSIDVEGGEKEVIQSIDFDGVFIDVIGFENNYADVSAPIQQYLESRGYHRFLTPDAPTYDIFMVHRQSPFYRR